MPRFFVTLPLTGAVEGQVVSLVGFTPRVDALAESVGVAWGAVLDIADGEAAVEARVVGVADMAGEGAVAVSSAFFEQLDRAIATEKAKKSATGRSLILVFIQPFLKEWIKMVVRQSEQTVNEHRT